jgi:hypothetical protein
VVAFVLRDKKVGQKTKKGEKKHNKKRKFGNDERKNQ